MPDGTNKIESYEVVAPTWIKPLLSNHQSEKRVGVVGGLQVAPPTEYHLPRDTNTLKVDDSPLSRIFHSKKTDT